MAKQTKKNIARESEIPFGENLSEQTELQKKTTKRKSGTKSKVNVSKLKPKTFDPKKPIYIQLRRNNLIHYTKRSLIIPEQYVNESRSFEDEQSINPHYLLLSNGILTELSDDYCLIQVNLVGLEKFLQIESGIAYTAHPIPFSRIESIYFNNKKSADFTKSIIETGNEGFIPSSLIEFKFPKTELVPLKGIDERGKDNGIDNWLQNYNRSLGAIAYAINADLLFTSKTNQYATIPLNLLKSVIHRENNFEDNKIHEFLEFLITEERNFEFPLLVDFKKHVARFSFLEDHLLLDVITKLHKYAGNENLIRIIRKALESKTNKLEIFQELHNQKNDKKIRFQVFLILLVYFYRSVDANDKYIVRKAFIEFTPVSYRHFALMILGYYYGYNRLPNFEEKDNINLVNNFYAKKLKASKINNTIRFNFESAIEPAIIEWCYSRVFLSRNPDFDQLVDLKIKKPTNYRVPNDITLVEKITFRNELFQEYKLTDKKPEIANRITQFRDSEDIKLHIYPSEINFDKYLFAFLVKQTGASPKLRISLNKDNSVQYFFLKTEVADYFDLFKSDLDIHLIKKLIDLDSV